MKHITVSSADFTLDYMALQCRSFVMTEVADAVLGPCASIITPDTVFLTEDFPCQRNCKQYCGSLYQKYSDKRSMDSWELLDLKSTNVVREARLIPILFYWGHAFPHVVKDVMPRVVASLNYLNAHPEAKFLMDRSDAVDRFLRRLNVSEERVVFTEFHTPDTRSLYSPEYDRVYYADTLVFPHCHPGPLVSGIYSKELYADLHKALVPSSKDSIRDLVIYISREGGHNSSKRRINNELELVEALRRMVEPHARFEYFKGNENTLDQALDLFASAKAVIGPHGGGFYNMIACSPGTIVLEFTPDDYGKNEVSRFAHKLDLDYHGFIKRGMKRSEGFGNVSIPWTVDYLQALLVGQSAPDTPDGWLKHQPYFLVPRRFRTAFSKSQHNQ